jgi:hypothetical protein
METSSDVSQQRERFIAYALLARQQILSEGVGYDAKEVHRYIRARIAGQNPQRPETPLGENRSRQLGLLAGQVSVCFGDDFAMTEEELVDLSPVNQQKR